MCALARSGDQYKIFTTALELAEFGVNEARYAPSYERRSSWNVEQMLRNLVA